MSDNPRKALMKEAAAIFLQLRDNPDDPTLQAMRDKFISRGAEERQVYEHLLRTWKASGVAQAPKTLKSMVLFLCALIGAGALAYDPIKLTILADLTTNSRPEQSSLSSGDIAYLDADTALTDHTDGPTRAVELLEGAAFFTVENGERPFTVDVGSLSVTVIGTEFETAFIDDTIMVSVEEGQVSVRHENQTWDLIAGDKLVWSNEFSVEIEKHERGSVAAWRRDRLTVDGLTMGQATAVIERRLRGSVIFTSSALSDTVVAGNVDLSRPLVALRILADTVGGRVIRVPGVGHVITER